MQGLRDRLEVRHFYDRSTLSPQMGCIIEGGRMADDYEHLADKIELSHEEALALKEEMRKR
jgi:hypothetical protein